MNLELENKIAVITGGSKGIGLAVARELAAEKVNVVLVARDENIVRNESEKIKKEFGVKTLGLSCDVSKVDDINSAVKFIKEQFESVDILINNAGTGSNETIMDADDEKWQYYWDLHVMAAIRFSRSLVPLMRRNREGVIINNASICAKQPLGYEPIYNVTKSALMMFSKCLANEIIKDNIRVNCINPGLVLTGDWKKTAKQLSAEKGITWEKYLENIAKENAPIGRFATPVELAHFIVFMCSPKSSYCVGSSYYVDGGWLNSIS